MKQVLVIIIILILISCRKEKNNPKTVNIQITISEPKRVLDTIIVVAKDQSLYNKNVNWNVLEKEVYSKFIDSDTITSIIKPVQYLLNQLGDYHGFLFLNGQRYSGNIERIRNVSYDYQGKEYINKMSLIYQKTLSQDQINGFILTNQIAYIEIPMILPNGGNSEDIIEYTNKIRSKICELKTKKPIAWIIDLRGNLGGNMYPMLMGLAEILPLKVNMGGDSKDGNSINQKWLLKDGVFYYGEDYYPNIPALKCHIKNNENKIAVLIGRYTASSGEVVASALKGQDNIKLFGEQTSGATTSNRWIPIGKDVVFNPAISYYVSKNKTIHKDGVFPDIEIIEDYDFKNPTLGKVYKESVKWINADYNNIIKK